jgi:hypothetical protein
MATSRAILLSGRGPTFGTSISSYRAEVFGILAWSLYLWHYSQFLQIKVKGILYPFCDNITAVNSMNEVSAIQPKHSMQSDYDIIMETKFLLASLPQKQWIDIFTHVKGHQDKHKPLHELSWEAQPNVEANRLANIAMIQRTRIPNVPVGKNPIYLTVGDTIIQSNELHVLRWRWREIELQNYYQRCSGSQICNYIQ